MSKALKISLLSLFLMSSSMAIGLVVNAGDENSVMGAKKETATQSDGGPALTIGNPLGDNIKTPQQLIGRIINTALGLVGSLALLMFIYGGFMWMTAAGNDDRIKKGKETLTWATLGLIVIFSSYALVSYLIKNVIKGG